MVELLIERAWAKLHASFPERQVYIRSEGRIQFFTFSSGFQATCAGLCLIFLGWVAFTSVNVVFKDRIIAARDHRYHQMQGSYENRVADLQLSYDELNDSLVSAEDRFKSTVDELAAKQRSIAGLIHGKPSSETLSVGPIGKGANTGWLDSGKSSESSNGTGPANESLDRDKTNRPPSPGYSPPIASSGVSRGSGSSELGVLPEPVEPQPRTARPLQANMFGALLQAFRAVLPSHLSTLPVRPVNSRELSMLAEQTQRAYELSRSETGIVIAFDAQLLRKVAILNATLTRAGIRSAPLQHGGAGAGTGGPLVPLQDVRMKGISDAAFVAAYADATAREAQLDGLTAALSHVPLAMPVRANEFTFSSGYGPRVDPFTGRVAMHTGVDLAGPWGASVYATADGVVIWAGLRGGYGNMVEIDHGCGFHTRYGHLSAISVRVGERVQTGTFLGRVGSTGRSTGPHLHYEVWLADSVRDPNKYLELGRHLFTD